MKRKGTILQGMRINTFVALLKACVLLILDAVDSASQLQSLVEYSYSRSYLSTRRYHKIMNANYRQHHIVCSVNARSIARLTTACENFIACFMKKQPRESREILGYCGHEVRQLLHPVGTVVGLDDPALGAKCLEPSLEGQALGILMSESHFAPLECLRAPFVGLIRYCWFSRPWIWHCW